MLTRIRSALSSHFPRLGLVLMAAALAAPAVVLADGFGGGGRIGGDGSSYDAGPFAVVYDGSVYAYTIGSNGSGYYATYDGAWSDWTGWDDQPATYSYQPVAVVNGDAQYIFYRGADGGLYHNGYGGADWWGWENLAGAYSFVASPYANVYDGSVYVYSVADDGNLYASWWDGDVWWDWAAINDGYAAAGYEAYGVEWGGYNNVFWTGQDGYIYWNRFDGSEWTGARQLPADDYSYDSAPYAIGYSGDGNLYAYAISSDGGPHWNIFTAGDGWAGWQPYPSDLPTTAKYQPNAYEYDGKQHLVVTGTDGHAYYATYDGTPGDWTDLGSNYDYDPYQYEYGGDYYLTYTGTDGNVYYKTYEPEQKGGY